MIMIIKTMRMMITAMIIMITMMIMTITVMILIIISNSSFRLNSFTFLSIFQLKLRTMVMATMITKMNNYSDVPLLHKFKLTAMITM